MAISIGTGNLLTQDVDALVNTVNTQGVMGKGIALQFKKAWPGMYADYQRACRRGEVQPGRMHVWATEAMSGPRWIINFPTKRHWRGRSRLQDIESGLTNLATVIGEMGITSIAVPPLGCGNGGLAWSDVEPRIRRALEPLAAGVEIRLFPPVGAPPAAEQPTREARPRLTPARAALLSIMRRYERLNFQPPSLVEVQKLAYFLQASGEPLRLTFVPHHYGPYADNLRKSLRELEGHYISGFGDGSATVDSAEPIEVTVDSEPELDAFIKSYPQTSARIEQVMTEIEGFESADGLELLASVHWLMDHDPAARDSAQQTSQQIAVWSQRKAAAFTQSHVETAWRAIRERALMPTP